MQHYIQILEDENFKYKIHKNQHSKLNAVLITAERDNVKNEE